MKTILLISAGAVLGANLRYGINRCTLHWFGGGFPWGTLFVNVVGSFLIGFVGTLLADRWMARADLIRYGVIVGFLGSLTTFSSLTWESHGLFQNSAWLRATLNLVGSLLLGLLVLRVGVVAAEVWATRAG